VLPVPATQYGAPGPGGVFDHRDVVVLDPPEGAATATIELLYQSTSWEYVQFLHLANTGAVATLAATGADLLEAWLATGMAEPEVVASATWTTTGGDPWTNVGDALAGTNGEPLLEGEGTLVGGTPVTFVVSGTLELAPLALVVGLSQLGAPFKGGVLVPSPDLLITGLSTDAGGGLLLPALWPVGVPSGVTTWYQAWIVDPAGPKGLAATNGVSGTTP